MAHNDDDDPLDCRRKLVSLNMVKGVERKMMRSCLCEGITTSGRSSKRTHEKVRRHAKKKKSPIIKLTLERIQLFIPFMVTCVSFCLGGGVD